MTDGLGYCPDASLDPFEQHEWRSCDAAPLTAAAELAAYLGTVESRRLLTSTV